MKFSIEKHDKYNVLTLGENKLTSEFAPDFKSEILLLSKESKGLICNLKNIEYVDSSGLSCFLIANRLLKEESLSFVICNANDKVSNLIKLTKLETVLTNVPTIQESIDYILLDDLEKQL